jgi:hypothetical protein
MKESRFIRIAVMLCLMVPPVVFFLMFFCYTVDIPVNDDYKAVLNFINQLINANGLGEKLALIFSHHNEHMIVYCRVWTIVSYKLHGQVDFNFLALIGNLSIFGIFFIFYKKLREVNSNVFYLLPIVVLLFNIGFWENMTFAMATLSNNTVFMFSLASLYFATKENLTRANLILALVFFVFAVFTQGGGLMLIPVIAAILLYRKERKNLLLFLGISIAITAFYFYGYQKPDEATTLMATLTNLKVRSVFFWLAFLGNAFNYYLIFTNDLENSIGITTVIGFALLACYGYAFKTKYYERNPFAFSVMTLLVITAFVTGFSRSHMGLETAGASRYRIGGVIFTIALYFWVVQTCKPSKVMKVLIALSSLLYFIFISLNQYEYLSYRKYKSMMGALRYQSGDHTQLNGFEQEYYMKVLIDAKKEQTYFLPSHESLEQFFPYSTIVDGNGKLVPSQIISSVDAIAKIKDSFILEGYAFDGASSSDHKTSIGLKASDGNIVYFSTKSVPRFDLNPYFHKFNLRDSGFFARLKLTDVKPGVYKVVIRLARDGEVKLFETDKTINF